MGVVFGEVLQCALAAITAVRMDLNDTSTFHVGLSWLDKDLQLCCMYCQKVNANVPNYGSREFHPENLIT